MPAIHAMHRVIGVVTLVLCGAAAAAAQDGPPPASRPLVLEPMESGFVLAPEVKVTKFNGEVGTLAGLSGGWLHDRQLLVGAALYSLTDDDHDTRGLTYGGLTLGWFTAPDRPLSLSARMLLGVGRVSEVVTIDRDGIPYCALPESYLCSGPGRFGHRPGFTTAYRLHDDFLLAEPELGIVTRVNDRLRVAAGAGYRLATRDSRRSPDARGATGTISVQFEF